MSHEMAIARMKNAVSEPKAGSIWAGRGPYSDLVPLHRPGKGTGSARRLRGVALPLGLEWTVVAFPSQPEALPEQPGTDQDRQSDPEDPPHERRHAG